MRGIVLGKHGDLNSLKLSEIDPPKTMSKDQVFIQSICTNISPDDVMLCDGRTIITDEQKKMIKVPGFSGIGKILKKGSNVKYFETGQLVGYMLGTPGSLSEKRVLHHSMLLNAESSIATDKLAVCFREFIMSYVLLYRSVKIRKNSFVMIHGVESGIGHILAQWCRYIGLKVIGTIVNENQRSFAARFCDKVISQESGNIFEETKDLTKARGVAVVFDGVGKSVFDISIKCLQFGGMYLNFNTIKEPMNQIDISNFGSKSIFFGRPRIEHYQTSKAEMIVTMQTVFDLVKKGCIDITTNQYSLENSKEAYNAVKQSNIKGSVIINI